jgi:hydroxymethylbilane synthase
VWQAEHVAKRLQSAFPGLRVRLERIRTTGDKILDIPLAQVGGKALFVKEIEEALLGGRVDLAVHSMKDVPTDLPAGLCIAAMLEREDPRDVLVSRTGTRFGELPAGARVGTSSLRRQAQLLHTRPDVAVVPLRGNLDTRLRKLDSEGLDAVVLAAAGVRRLGLWNRVTEVFGPEVLLPAVGQGALGIEIRAQGSGLRGRGPEGGPESPTPNPQSRTPNAPHPRPSPLGGEGMGEGSAVDRELRVEELVTFLDHPETHTAVRAERGLLRRLGGGCQVPIAAWAVLEGEGLLLQGLVASPDGQSMVRGEVRGATMDPEAVGTRLAEDLLGRGARAILRGIAGGEFRG